jgi:hypothetical protein
MKLNNIFGPMNPLRFPFVFLIIVPIFRRKSERKECKDNVGSKTESSGADEKKGGYYAG